MAVKVDDIRAASGRAETYRLVRAAVVDGDANGKRHLLRDARLLSSRNPTQKKQQQQQAEGMPR